MDKLTFGKNIGGKVHIRAMKTPWLVGLYRGLYLEDHPT